MLFVLPASAQDIFLEPGRIALLDCGSLINAKVQIVNNELVRVYSVSGLEDETANSILVIQGLKNSGKTDLTISTSSGLIQLRVILNKERTTDLELNPQASRLKIYNKTFELSSERAAIINLPAYINKQILVGDPDLIRVSQLLDYYDDNFLKNISIISSNYEGVTDLIIPSQSGVYKLTLNIKKENSHESIINLL